MGSRALLRRTAGVALIAVAVVLAAYSMWREEPSADGIARQGRPVVLITLDTLRADHLEPYGAEFKTPFFSRFAQDAVVFEQAFSVAPITLVAHTSMMTGLYPPQHGVRNNGMHTAVEELETLAERLSEAGWHTGAFVSAAVLEDRYGLDQGFDVYDDDLSTSVDRRRHTVPDRPASATIDSALQWLDTVPAGERFFLWLHLYDPHAPYMAPAEHREKHPDRPYVAEVSYVDAQLERLMEHPRLAVDEERDAPLVAIMGDHGESLGEHGEQTHALLAYDATLHIPFMLKIPGGPVGRVAEPVGQVDLMPTLLDALGLDSRIAGERESLGRSLLPAMAGHGIPRVPFYSETYLPHYTYGWAKLKVYRVGGFKWIDAPRPELFELSKDPRELTNVVDQRSGLAHDMARDLAALEARLGPELEHTQTLDSESREKLRSLGYLAIADAPARNDDNAADPKEMVSIHVALERARHLKDNGLFDLAETQLRGALERDPVNLALLGELADNLIQQGRFEEAGNHLQHALQLAPASAAFYLRLAALEAHRNRLTEALALADTALELAPDMIEAQIEKASVLQRLGRPDAVRALMAESLSQAPDHARLLLAHAVMVEMSGRDWPGAEKRLRRAVEVDPFLAPAWGRLGEVLELSRRFDDAVQAYESGLKRRPYDVQLNTRLGLLLARRGSEQAEGPLREALRLTPKPRSDLFMALGGWLQDRGRDGEAEQLYARWVDAGASTPLERNNQAIAYFGLGRLAEARALLEDLVRDYPSHVDALSNLAAVAAQQQDWAAAEQYARDAVKLGPRLADPWNTLGLALSGLGRADEAGAAFEKALELDPAYWRARLNLGDVLLELGDSRAAERAFLAVVEQSPSVREAHRKLWHLYEGPLADPAKAEHHRKASEAGR